jgi:hypothetical protein
LGRVFLERVWERHSAAARLWAALDVASGSLYVLEVMKLGEDSCPSGIRIGDVDLPGTSGVGA